jgi:hypothetical protein
MDAQQEHCVVPSLPEQLATLALGTLEVYWLHEHRLKAGA